MHHLLLHCSSHHFSENDLKTGLIARRAMASNMREIDNSAETSLESPIERQNSGVIDEFSDEVAELENEENITWSSDNDIISAAIRDDKVWLGPELLFRLY